MAFEFVAKRGIISRGNASILGIISSGEPSASYDGEVRCYQQGINLYTSLKSDSISAKAGMYRSGMGFFNYYNLLTGDTNLDTVFSGSSVILRVNGNEKLKITNSGNTLITGSLFVSNGITSSLQGTSSYALGIPKTKSGTISGSAFSGNPKIYSVTFINSFPNNLYSISVVGQLVRSWFVQSKSPSGFTINSNSNTVMTGMVFWNAIQTGEFYS